MPVTYTAFAVALVVAAVLVAIVFLMAPHRRRERLLRRTIRQISKDRLHDLVVPDGVEGEIQIDTVLLTAHGLLVLEIKRVDGKVFGGDRLDAWTAIAKERRVRFTNPVALMQKRVIALRALFRDVPVDGRVVFVGDVELGGDLPAQVTTVAGLRDEFAAGPAPQTGTQVDAWYPQWDELRRSSAA